MQPENVEILPTDKDQLPTLVSRRTGWPEWMFRLPIVGQMLIDDALPVISRETEAEPQGK